MYRKLFKIFKIWAIKSNIKFIMTGFFNIPHNKEILYLTLLQLKALKYLNLDFSYNNIGLDPYRIECLR